MRGDIHEPYLVFEVHEIVPWEWLHQNISYLIIGGDVLLPYFYPRHHVMYVVPLNLNMLWPIMEHMVL